MAGRLLAVSYAMLLAAGCSQMLDIEKAHIDPNTDAGSEGTSTTTEALCSRYCDQISANCTGALAQYDDLESCLHTCAVLPLGDAADTSGNSIYCRLQEAETGAALEPAAHCALAGPSGGGKCGSACEALCGVMASVCAQTGSASPHYYEDEGRCLSECAALPTAMEPYSAALHSAGPHVECRLYHAIASHADTADRCSQAPGSPPCELTPGAN